MYEREDLKGAVFDVKDVLERFRTILQQSVELIGPKPSVEDEEKLFKHVRIKAGNLAKDKDLERKFTENYRVLRRLYELIAPKLTRKEHEEYRWLSDIYTFYIKNLAGSNPEEELAEKYYKKTVDAIGRSLQILEREAEFSPITIDRKFFEEFIRSKDMDREEKASALIMGIFRFRLYARNDPIYVSVADKVEALLEKWRKKLKTSIELYEEAKRLWEEIYALRKEQAELRFGRREYLVYRTLIDTGFKQSHAKEVTKKLMKDLRKKISVPGWNHNPKLVHDVERIIAITMLREARKTGLSTDDVKKLIDLLVDRVKRIGAEQRE